MAFRRMLSNLEIPEGRRAGDVIATVDGYNRVLYVNEMYVSAEIDLD